MRILVTGAGGQVGSEFLRAGAGLGELIAAGRNELDLRDARAIREAVRRIGPDVIVNAGAYTAVDRAEKERDDCFAVNAVAPGVLAEEAERLGAMLVHYSTDYVFDGTRVGAYTEDDAVAPLSVYGASKAAGETAVTALGARALVLRTSWVYSAEGRNFLLTMLRLGREKPELRIVADQTGAPTSAAEIARATVRLIQEQGGRGADFPAGIYHMTASGSTSWFGFAKAIFERAGIRTPVLPIATVEYPTPAKRPLNSVLSNAKVRDRFGFALGPWEEQMEGVMAELSGKV